MRKMISSEISNPLRNTGVGPRYQNEDFLRMLKTEEIDSEGAFFAALFIGIRADQTDENRWATYWAYSQVCTAMQEEICDLFHEKSIGFPVYHDMDYIRLMGVFPKEHLEDFTAFYLEPIVKKVQADCNIPLCLGVGIPTDDLSQLKTSYQASQYAFELYFFERRQIIEFQNIHKDFNVSPEEYYDLVEDAFRAILAKDEQIYDKITAVVDLLGEIHYGNWRAVVMRTLDYCGVLTSRLYRYHLLTGDFFRTQDELQEEAFSQMTFADLKALIRRHFSDLLPQIYQTDKPSSKSMVEKVKLYMEENYMDNLSIGQLSDIACVSPNYFSHMFKRETGKNYKAYLTEIRMQKAQDLLLETDLMVYEISEMVGYNNTRTFVDAFKQAYSMSPADFRKKQKSK